MMKAPGFDDLSWMGEAHCSNLDVNVWIPDYDFSQGQAANRDVQQIGLQICRECPVQIECLNFALATTDYVTYGIWGGTTELQRKALKNTGISFVSDAGQIPTHDSLTHAKVRLMRTA